MSLDVDYADEVQQVFHVVPPSQRKEIGRVLRSQSQEEAERCLCATLGAHSRGDASVLLLRQDDAVVDIAADVSVLQFLLLAGICVVLRARVPVEGA